MARCVRTPPAGRAWGSSYLRPQRALRRCIDGDGGFRSTRASGRALAPLLAAHVIACTHARLGTLTRSRARSRTTARSLARASRLRPLARSVCVCASSASLSHAMTSGMAAACSLSRMARGASLPPSLPSSPSPLIPPTVSPYPVRIDPRSLPVPPLRWHCCRDGVGEGTRVLTWGPSAGMADGGRTGAPGVPLEYP